MATTGIERMQATRERRRRGDVQLLITVAKTDMRSIAAAGYVGAVSTSRKLQEDAVALFVSDQCVRPAGA